MMNQIKNNLCLMAFLEMITLEEGIIACSNKFHYNE